MRHLFQIVLICIGLFGGVLFGQTAESLFDSAVSYNKQGRNVESKAALWKSIEMAAASDDTSQLISSYNFLGSLYSVLRSYDSAYLSYHYSLSLCTEARYHYFFSFLKDIGLVYDKYSRAYPEQYLGIRRDLNTSSDYYPRIGEVWEEEGQRYFNLSATEVLGFYSKYVSLYTTREGSLTGEVYKYIGYGESVLSDSLGTMYKLFLESEPDTLFPYKGDVVQATIRTPEHDGDLLIENYLMSCTQKGRNAEFPLSLALIYSQDYELVRPIVLAYYKEILVSTFESFSNDETYAFLWDTARKGIYKGLPVWEVLKSPSQEDVLHFLRYINDYPLKYVGCDYKFGETCVTWLMLSCPVSEQYFSELLVANLSEIETWFSRYEEELRDSTYLKFWMAQVEKYAGNFNYGKAIEYATLISRYYGYICDSLAMYNSLLDLAEFYSENEEPWEAYSLLQASEEYFRVQANERRTEEIKSRIDRLKVQSIQLIPQVNHTLPFISAMHPNGRQIYTGGWDGVIKIWDVKTGKIAFSNKYFDFAIKSLEVSADGKFILASDNFGTLKLINTKSFEEVYSYEHNSGIITSCSIDPQNYLIAFGGGGSWIWILDWQADSIYKIIKQHRAEVLCVKYGRKNGHLFSAGRDSTLYVWNYGLTQWYHRFSEAREIRAMVISDDESYFATICEGGYVGIWDNILLKSIGNTEVESFEYADGGTYSIPCFSPDNRYFVFSYEVRNIEVYHLASRKSISYNTGLNYFMISQILFHPKGHTLIAATSDFVIPFQTWDLESYRFNDSTGFNINSVETTSTIPTLLSFDHEGRHLVASAYSSNSVCIGLDLTNGSKLLYEAQLFIGGTENGHVQINDHITSISTSGEFKEYDPEGKLSFTRRLSELYSYISYTTDLSSKQIYFLTKYQVIHYDMVSNREIRRVSLPDNASVGNDINESVAYTQIAYNYLTGKIYVLANTRWVYELDPLNMKFKKRFNSGKGNKVGHFKFCREQRVMVLCTKRGLLAYDLLNGKRLWKYEIDDPSNEGYTVMEVSEDGERIYLGNLYYKVAIYEPIADRMTELPFNFNWFLTSMAIHPKLNILAVGCEDGQIYVLDLDKIKISYEVIIQSSGDYVMLSEENYYWAPKQALEGLAFSSGTHVYTAMQFDLEYNRPDLLLSQLCYADQNYLKAVEVSTEKRLLRTEALDLSQEILPGISILNRDEIRPVSSTEDLKVVLKITDLIHGAREIQVSLNGVQIKVIPISEAQMYNDTLLVTVPLSKGRNVIKFKVVNLIGVSSLEEVVITSFTEGAKPQLYLAVLSVSHFLDSAYNLKYASKDGMDLSNLFSSDSTLYQGKHVLQLFDSQVTLSNLTRVREHFNQAGINDKVILYLSGHGLLDDAYDFYFASYDCDFRSPEKTGIPYDSIIGLFSTTKSIQRLLIMDACHSGEVDKGEIRILGDSVIQGTKAGVKRYSYRGTVASDMDTAGLSLFNTFDLMKEMFSEVSGDGIQVISASAGDSYALESAEWNNGVFTYAILQGISTGEADLSKDGFISVSELRDYVIYKVYDLTDGAQKPTVRQENIEFDFRIW